MKRCLAIDFESTWGREIKLGFSCQTNEEYLRDPRFKAWGLCWQEFDFDAAPWQPGQKIERRAVWVRGKDVQRWVDSVDWDSTAVVAHNCVTGDHEVRTRSGWVRLDMLADDVDVLQWCPRTQRMSWVPAQVVRAPYKGDMYVWNTRYHRGQYTPNHRMYYQTPTTAGVWREAPADIVATMAPNNVYLPTTGTLTASEELFFTPLEARIMEMVRADGNITPSGDVRFKFKKERKIARCCALLDAAGISYGITRGVATTIRTRAHARVREMSRLLGIGRSKALGEWVLRFSLESRQAWIGELAFWDGSRASDDGAAQVVLHTAKREDAYWLAEMAFCSGMAAQVRYDIPNTRGFSRPDSVLHRVCVRMRTRAKLVEPATRLQFEGTVYCLRTDTGAFPVRRNGVVWMTGNSLFDVSVLSWHYGAKPAFVLDTLSMARARFGVEAGNSLAALAERFNLPPKGTELASSENLLDELPFNIEQGLADYCRHDTWLLIEIFKRLREGYPVSELRLIDMTLKMYTQACLRLDGTLLQDAIEEERVAREGLLQRLGIDEAALASNDRFADVLRGLGVEPPTKISKKTKQHTFAFAKTDAMFQALLNGDREDIALLCEARMKVKSTMARTRAQRFFDISQRGPLPVPLSYYGASTGRWTAAKGSAINMQNLKRGSFLRDAVMAPEGHVLVVGDLSQIEPRVLAWLSDYDDLLDIFRSGGDPYAQFGAQMFQIPGMTKDSHPVERQSSKSALLGAGYGLGWSAFAAQLLTGFLGAPPLRYNKQDAKKLGVDAAYIQKFLSWDENIVRMRAIPHSCTEEELLVHCLAAKAIIDRYRGAAIPVTDLWELLKQLIEYSLYGGKEYTHKCLLFRKEEIVLPNGMSIRYPDLKPERDAKGRVQWTYNSGKKRDKLYAGKVTNNITQATARIIMTDGVLRTSRRYFVAGTVHDEQIAVVPEVEATEALPWVIAQMTKPPSFMPDIPLAADGGFHSRYGKAKK